MSQQPANNDFPHQLTSFTTHTPQPSNKNLHTSMSAMDWFSWLSKTHLHPSLVHHYAQMFTRNDLACHDISQFTHEFLQGMGVSVAKHRLEILNLARKKKWHQIAWLMLAIKQARQACTMIHRESIALAITPVRNNSLRWKVAMLQRNKRTRAAPSECGAIRNDDNGPVPVAKHSMLMLTNASDSSWVESESNAVTNKWNSSFSSMAVNLIEGENWMAAQMKSNGTQCFRTYSQHEQSHTFVARSTF